MSSILYKNSDIKFQIKKRDIWILNFYRIVKYFPPSKSLRVINKNILNSFEIFLSLCTKKSNNTKIYFINNLLQTYASATIPHGIIFSTFWISIQLSMQYFKIEIFYARKTYKGKLYLFWFSNSDILSSCHLNTLS